MGKKNSLIHKRRKFTNNSYFIIDNRFGNYSIEKNSNFDGGLNLISYLGFYVQTAAKIINSCCEIVFKRVIKYAASSSHIHIRSKMK